MLMTAATATIIIAWENKSDLSFRVSNQNTKIPMN
jgi:hypothetical protein